MAGLLPGGGQAVGFAQEAGGQTRQAVHHREGSEVQRRQRDRGRRTIIAFKLTEQHVGAVGGKQHLGEETGEAAAGLGKSEKRAGSEVQTVQHPPPGQQHFAAEPVTGLRLQKAVVG